MKKLIVMGLLFCGMAVPSFADGFPDSQRKPAIDCHMTKDYYSADGIHHIIIHGDCQPKARVRQQVAPAPCNAPAPPVVVNVNVNVNQAPPANYCAGQQYAQDSGGYTYDGGYVGYGGYAGYYPAAYRSCSSYRGSSGYCRAGSVRIYSGGCRTGFRGGSGGRRCR